MFFVPLESAAFPTWTCARIPCAQAPTEACVLAFMGILEFISIVHGSSSSRLQTPPPPPPPPAPHFPPSFPLFTQCDGCLPSAWGLMAGLPGFVSHGPSSLYLGAGCQKWKLLDISGNQPPFCDTVVNVNKQTTICRKLTLQNNYCPLIQDSPMVIKSKILSQ